MVDVATVCVQREYRRMREGGEEEAAGWVW